MSEPAWRIWDAVYPVLSDGKPGLLGAVISRAEAQTRRLAALFALLDEVAEVYLWTHEAWLYLVVILDLFSRRVVGWALHDRITRQLAVDALTMALRHRQPCLGLVPHSGAPSTRVATTKCTSRRCSSRTRLRDPSARTSS